MIDLVIKNGLWLISNHFLSPFNFSFSFFSFSFSFFSSVCWFISDCNIAAKLLNFSSNAFDCSSIFLLYFQFLHDAFFLNFQFLHDASCLDFQFLPDAFYLDFQFPRDAFYLYFQFPRDAFYLYFQFLPDAFCLAFLHFPIFFLVSFVAVVVVKYLLKFYKENKFVEFHKIFDLKLNKNKFIFKFSLKKIQTGFINNFEIPQKHALKCHEICIKMTRSNGLL